MKLIIDGDDKKVKQIAKELKIRASRDGLKLSLESEAKAIEAKEPKVVKAKKTKAKK